MLLTVTDLCKKFGGVVATDKVNLSVTEGEVHAIIGPNGAGKTTLISQLAGQLKSDSGTIKLADLDITNFSIYQRAQAGLGRTFQRTNIMQNMTLLDNVRLAAQANSGHSFRFWRAVNTEQKLIDRAYHYLTEVGLLDNAKKIAAAVSSGEQRQLELAMVLATEPKLLLLDEPTAGLSGADRIKMIRLLTTIKSTIILIEHDMDVVFDLASRISVLVNGRIIASGSGAEIRENQAVQIAYLGDA